MKKVAIVLIMVFFLSGCGGQNQTVDDPSLEKQEGVIAHKREIDDNDNQILLIPNTERDEVVDKSVSQLTGMALEKGGAYYYVDSDEYIDLVVGTKAMVYWNGTQEDSEIPQREAQQIDLVSE
ncbi:DUF3221 domain-containing protein [Salimicrobium halophilum]|uniref:DUF3221 domain-containing protein n=1 Tax=Salimicrobium halophilum TaxID=86666 RepID=UPI00115F8F9B|nr:DUF3221 domain-containing protein [Salimicrobium halophilum]